ncbi:hypothetical protein N9N67_05110 [Bacteriovoracaceae bacterium]|nr:hypothetical protein [Bacteriovoracaceae bacterium]
MKYLILLFSISSPLWAKKNCSIITSINPHEVSKKQLVKDLNFLNSNELNVRIQSKTSKNYDYQIKISKKNQIEFYNGEEIEVNLEFLEITNKDNESVYSDLILGTYAKKNVKVQVFDNYIEKGFKKALNYIKDKKLCFDYQTSNSNNRYRILDNDALLLNFSAGTVLTKYDLIGNYQVVVPNNDLYTGLEGSLSVAYRVNPIENSLLFVGIGGGFSRGKYQESSWIIGAPDPTIKTEKKRADFLVGHENLTLTTSIIKRKTYAPDYNFKAYYPNQEIIGFGIDLKYTVKLGQNNKKIFKGFTVNGFYEFYNKHNKMFGVMVGTTFAPIKNLRKTKTESYWENW